MKKVNIDNTGFRGVYLTTSLQRLVDVFGNEDGRAPTIDGKVTHEWAFEIGPTSVITIYDYKNPPIDDDAKCRWHIGGKHLDQALIREFLLNEGFNDDEIELEDSPLYK